MSPSYFYHLAFELYSHPLTPNEDFLSHPAKGEVYLPPPETNIFSTSLPEHQKPSWASPPRKRKNTRRSRTAANSVDLTNRNHPSSARPSYSERRKSHLDTKPLSHDSTSKKHSEAPLAAKDWRFDSVSIQSIDMVPVAGGTAAAAAKDNAQALTSSRVGVGLATKGVFVPGEVKNTEVGWGVVHLYRDSQETPGLYYDTSSSAGSEGDQVEEADKQDFKEEDCTTLCILAVPSYMTPSDLLGFVGEQTREDVSHFRQIRTARANKYMVLMKFREARKARQWRKDWNGKLFNSMEPENCHVVFVKSIQFQTPGEKADPSSFPSMTNDPFTPTARPTPTAPIPGASESSALPTSLSTKPLPPPTSSLVELPTCPVCLERMDETTGLLTILCQHVFHCACLEKWRGSGCPVCRYTQNDSLVSRGNTADGEAPENECSVCGTNANLWICLICGNIGCGRYDSAHAFQHYEATSHSYAMDITTQHVWDYAGDGYVHRLVQNKADGKLVDLPAAHHPNSSMTGFADDYVPREKLDNMGVEYTYLLTSQLDSQRLYFEEQLDRAVDKAAKATQAAEEAAATASAMMREVRELREQHTSAKATISSLERDVARLTTKADKADNLARSMTKQYQEEKTFSGSLMKRIKHLDAKMAEVDDKNKMLEAEKQELMEQNRDLSFFISGQEKLKQLEQEDGEGGLGDEVREGTVEVGPTPPEKSKKRKGKGKK